MRKFLFRWLLTTIAVFLASHLVSGIHYQSWGSLLAASLFLGLINAVLKPILMLISLPLVLLTFGLFTLIINSFLLILVGEFIRGFYVTDWWSAFWGSLVISIVTMILKIFQTESKSIRMNIQSVPSSNQKGKVIDV